MDAEHWVYPRGEERERVELKMSKLFDEFRPEMVRLLKIDVAAETQQNEAASLDCA